MSNLFNNKLVSSLNKLNITSFKSGVNEANESERNSNLIADMALNKEKGENNRENIDSRIKMQFNRSSSDPNLGEASLDRNMSHASGYSTPNKGHSSAGSMPGVEESTLSMSTENGIRNQLTEQVISTLSPGEREGINGTESMSYGGASIVNNRATPILSAGSSVSKDELNRRYYDPYRTSSDVGSYLEESNQLFTMKTSPEVTRGDQGGCIGENTRTSSEPARLDYRSGLEKESSISSDYCLFSESYGKCNFSDFSKNNLVLLLSFINTITRETLPVKCILLTLKTLLKCVKCELIELCQIDDNDLIINYMFKEGMLHKKEVKYHKRGLYNLVLSTGMMIKVDDVASDERYIKECDQHTELSPRNIVLIPLYNLQQSIWGVVSLANYRGAPVSSVGGSGGYGVAQGGVIGSTGSSNGVSRVVRDGYGTGGIGSGPVSIEGGPGFEVSRAMSSESNLEREDSLMEGVVNNGNAINGGGMTTDVNLVVVENNSDIFGNSSTMDNKEGKMEKFSGLNDASEEEENNIKLDQEDPGEKINARINLDNADVHTGNSGSTLTSIGGTTGMSGANADKETTDIPSANANTNGTTNTVTASSNHSPIDSRYTTINSINSTYGSRSGNVNGLLGNGQIGGIGYSQMDEEKLKFISYLCFMSGIIISNAMEKIELEINKLKSNSLITLMHSLFSDQLGIQSCVIALTTHAKKLIQAESCAVYLVDQSRNQLWSISSNTGEQSVYSLDNNNNILSICVNTSKIIIYDNDLVNDGNLFNKSNILAISNGTSVLDANEMTTGVGSSASSTSSRMSGSSFLLGQASHEVNGRAPESTTGVSETGVDKEVLEKLRMLRNGIWVPIKHDNRVLAVIEVVNKQAQELLHFTEDDLNLLELFAVIVGPQFERSEFASAGLAKKTTEAGLAFENVDKYLNNNVKNFIEQSIIEEEEAIME
ncbi:hypothetical protein MACK_001107 [Theileria orientalis]|uniref:GAF domain-containing protein n=1 Tax=Theileria orientalis TaxID=68886 RepID=A0A976QX46_THEOR|nr:hypothetical protein MACK_001107 [Theileria orientalis]